MFDNYQIKLISWMVYYTYKTYLNIHIKTNLKELDAEGTMIIVDYKIKILLTSARKIKRDFFEKCSWSLYSVLVYTKNIKNNCLNIQVYNYWSGDTY